MNVSTSQLYKTQKKLLYPVNVGRNIGRDAAMTHFILASDIELYPNPGLAKKFLEMIARNDAPLQRKNPRVFPLSLFEVDSASQVPRDKTELQELLKSGKAIPFHKRVCSSCHGVPKSKEWMAANETDGLYLFFLLHVFVCSYINHFHNLMTYKSCGLCMFSSSLLLVLHFRFGSISHWQTYWLFCALGADIHWNTR